MSARTQRSFTGSSITGVGDAVIQFPENKNKTQILTINGNSSDRYFGVRPYDCNGKRLSSIVNTSDPYNGTVRSPTGACYLQIEAEGEWSISR